MNKLDELEKELDGDVGPGSAPLFRGTGVPGRPSTTNMFGAEIKVSINDMLRADDEAKLLTTEAQVLHERARRKEQEAMKKGLR